MKKSIYFLFIVQLLFLHSQDLLVLHGFMCIYDDCLDEIGLDGVTCDRGLI